MCGTQLTGFIDSVSKLIVRFPEHACKSFLVDLLKDGESVLAKHLDWLAEIMKSLDRRHWCTLLRRVRTNTPDRSYLSFLVVYDRPDKHIPTSLSLSNRRLPLGFSLSRFFSFFLLNYLPICIPDLGERCLVFRTSMGVFFLCLQRIHVEALRRSGPASNSGLVVLGEELP